VGTVRHEFSLAIQVGGQLFSPAIEGVLPKLLENPQDDLAPLNALLGIGGQGLRLTAYAAGGVVIATLGAKTGILVDTLSFGLFALSFLWVRVPPHAKAVRGGVRTFISNMETAFGFCFIDRCFGPWSSLPVSPI
jgi:hypothetical protein